jgi:hypothetical protein
VSLGASLDFLHAVLTVPAQMLFQRFFLLPLKDAERVKFVEI